jgi:hypothetical protein
MKVLMILVVASIMRTRLPHVSDTNTLPEVSVHTPHTPFKVASTAKPPSPVDVATPVPAYVVMTVVARFTLLRR